MQNILNGREGTMQTQGKCSQQKVQPRKGEKMRAEMVCIQQSVEQIFLLLQLAFLCKVMRSLNSDMCSTDTAL